MKKIDINFIIENSTLEKSTADTIEDLIKSEIINHVVPVVLSQLDNDNFISMEPHEHGYSINLSLIIGQSKELIEATTDITLNLTKSEVCKEPLDTRKINNILAPLINLLEQKEKQSNMDCEEIVLCVECGEPADGSTGCGCNTCTKCGEYHDYCTC